MEDFYKQKTLPDLGESRPLPIPQTVGPYKIESVLSKGGMSVLYLASHPEKEEPIVIKILLPKYFKNKEMASRFLKEAQIIGMTNHPNIVRLYDQGQWEKGLYIAMEFIQGISLRQFIKQKSLSNKRALEIILQVAYALSHLHSHGVIHRDLKPENILITETGAIKVIDFGIAQVHGEQDRLTQKKKMMGTPVYMSPEQKETPLQISFTSDIYALGIIAYELILGRLSHGVIHLNLLQKSLRPIIERALKIDPKERYPDIVDFITDVSEYIGTSSEKKDEEIESDEMIHLVDYAQRLLIPKKIPNWSPLEIGLSSYEGVGLYLDFFKPAKNRYSIVLAEVLETSVTTLLHNSIFRAMMRSAMKFGFNSPVELLQNLNQMLFQDQMTQTFALSLLTLNAENNLVSFISCGSTPLWHIPKMSTQIHILQSPNPPLGSSATTSFLESRDNWNEGDTLILHSLGLKAPETPNLDDILPLRAQSQADKVLEKLSNGQVKRGTATLTIQRPF